MNRTVFEPARNVPVTHEADVVVCGGGTAGIACAVCAARLGLQVVMISPHAHIEERETELCYLFLKGY